MDLPLYLIFGARPVKFERTEDGGMDILAFEWETGEFVRDMNYLSRYVNAEPEMDVVTKREFDATVRSLRRKRVWRTIFRLRNKVRPS